MSEKQQYRLTFTAIVEQDDSEASALSDVREWIEGGIIEQVESEGWTLVEPIDSEVRDE